MNKIEFIGISKNRALKKAISFWYKKFYNQMTLKEFTKCCTIKKVGFEYIITYYF